MQLKLVPNGVFDILRPSAGNSLFVASITGAEVVAALARKRKGKRLTSGQAAKAISRFQRHFSLRYQKITITDSLVKAAMNYGDKYELRGYDAVQQIIRFARGDGVVTSISQVTSKQGIYVFIQLDFNLAHRRGARATNPGW